MQKVTQQLPDIYTLINEFRSALTEEIEFIKKEGGGFKFIARNGQLMENRGTKFIYQFIIDDPAGLPDDVPIQIRYGRDNVQGSIIAIEGVMILVALDQNIGTKVSEVTIIADPYYLLEILNKRLEEVQSRKLSINVPLVEKLFGLTPCNNGENFEYPVQTGYQLNDSQREAIAKALGSDISFIWGPPGTGKTTTLAALAEILFNQGKSILILSHTNVAVDNAIDKISEYMKKHGNKELLEGKVLRLGNAQEGFFQKHPEVWLDHWIGEKSNELKKNRNLLEMRLLEYESERSEKSKVLELYGNVDKLQTIIDNTKEQDQLIERERSQTDSSLKELRYSLEMLEEKITEATKRSKVWRLFTGISLEKLNNRKVELREAISMCEMRLESAKDKIIIIEQQLKEQKRKLEELEKKLKLATREMTIIIDCENRDCNQKLRIKPPQATKGIVTCPICGQRFEYSEADNYVSEKRLKRDMEDFDSWIDTLKDNIREIDARLERIEGEILKDVKLLATTLTKGYTESNIYNRRFDVVIVDEGSMAPLPMLFFDCGLATQKIIVIGDFRQLAPIARSDAEIVNRWLKTDIFDYAGIITDVENGTKSDKLVPLVEQHRMHPSIMAVVNEPIYDGNLKAGRKAPEALEKETKTVAAQPFEGQNIIICDTSTFNPWCSMTSNGSPFNIYSACLSLYLAERALDSGINEIAIISPYAAQTRLLYKLVTDRGYTNIDPSSVHRFQGKERELIILDLVEGPVRQIRWLGSEDRKTDAGRLINVAITRAKSKLIIVANLGYLDKKLSGNSILRRILFSIRNNHPIVDANTFFDFIPDVFDIEKMIDNEKLLVDDINIDDKNYFFSQAYFYPFFYNDLQNCEKEVIIFSPFVTKRRTDSFINYFRELLSNDIRVILITRPSTEQISFIQESVDEVLDYLQKCGVEVIKKKKMHEKLAIIDKKIIWHGSLNILSHKNTTELMTRIKIKTQEAQKAQTAEEVLKLFGINIDRLREEEKLKSRIRTLNERGFGLCPNCGSKMVARQGRFGLFLSCDSYRSGCKETMQVDEKVIEAVHGKEYMICELCEGRVRLKIKWNPKRRSRFLGCPNYPKCRFTRPI